jgi:hypothetical protein
MIDKGHLRDKTVIVRLAGLNSTLAPLFHTSKTMAFGLSEAILSISSARRLAGCQPG